MTGISIRQGQAAAAFSGEPMARIATTARIPLLLLLFLLLGGFTAFRLLHSGHAERTDGARVHPTEARTASGRAASADDKGMPVPGTAKHSVRGSADDEILLSRPSGDGFGLLDPIDGDLPEVIRSQVRALVPAGHSMVTGGHLLADGRREFAVVTPKWMELPGESKQIEIEVELLNLDDAGVKAAGLDTLLTGERKSEQNAEVWTPEELARTMKDVDQTALQSKPRIVTSPGLPATISLGTEPGAKFELEFFAREAADGGFELTTDLKRID